MDCIVHGVAKSQTQLSDFHFHFSIYAHTHKLGRMESRQSDGSHLSQMSGCCCYVASVVSDSVRPHRQQPIRLLHPWDSPGKNTGMGCHFLLQCVKVKSESEITQSRPTLCDPLDYSPPGSSVPGILQARVLEWGAIAFSVAEAH